MDIATRVWNHNFKLDPIYRSSLDQDFYKFLMAQLIWKKHRDTEATFQVINRSKTVNLFQNLSIPELRAQLDHARTVKFTRGDMTWLRGNTFYGKRQIFDPEFLDWLETFQLPEYNLEIHNNEVDLKFEGKWLETTFWEIPALSIINELRSRSVMSTFSELEIDITYSLAKTKLWEKLTRLSNLQDEASYTISDFGTRRRHSFLWQQYCVRAMQAELPNTFIGTSNALLAKENNLEAIGTNAHELPMVYAALTTSDPALLDSRYVVLDDWAEMYEGNLRVMLPDAFGTTRFLKDLPERFWNWRGIRPDSKEWFYGVKEALKFWEDQDEDPKDKLVVLSDGMTITDIEMAVAEYGRQTNIAIGWGTNLTNDFQSCDARNYYRKDLDPISVVCKVISANGLPAVKLSDNPTKATGNRLEIDRYLKIFGTDGMKEEKVYV